MWAVGDSIRQGEVHGEVTAVDGCTIYYWLENGTCGGCLPHRLEKGYRMSRPRKTADEKAKAAAAKETNGLLEAVKFCSGGFKDGGEIYASHALIWEGYISTYNGIVMFGHKIDTAMKAAPHYGRLLAALKATDGSAVQITQTDNERLHIKQKGFRTVVPCIADIQLVARTAPDTPVGMLDSRMREGFEAMKQIAIKSGDTILESAVLIGNGFMVACDNHMLGQYWHGLGFPEIAVPADFVEAILRIAKPLVSFGYTPDRSVTFYFDDGSFVRSQLYAEKYPDYERALPEHFENCPQLPDGFFDALAKIKPFLDKDSGRHHAYMSEHLFHTDEDPETGTAVECPGLLDSPIAMPVERALRLRDTVTHFDYTHEKMRFVGPNFRGVLMGYGTDPVETVAEGFAQHVEMHDAAVQAGTWQPQDFTAPQPPADAEIDDNPPDAFMPADEWVSG